MKPIPKDKVAFYFSDLQKIGGLETIPVTAMPFNIDDLPTDTQERWKYLKNESVNFLREQKKIPSFAQEQDYERKGYASFCPLNDFVALAENLAKEPEQEKKEIKVFNNAFDKIVLPSEYKERIIETIAQLKDSKLIFDEWGFGDKFKKGRGINLLFSGESGTGKTYCGEVIAEYLGTTFNLVSSSTIEDKWVGNTEKNISRLFKALDGNNSVLIIDEADSFLTTRSDNGKFNHDNKLTNQLLIELERHNGICIMTTNRPVRLDRALQRRIDLTLTFPFPDKNSREAIWKHVITEKVPKEKIDYARLASRPVNGGAIKNSILSAVRKMIVRKQKKLTTDLIEEAILEEEREIEEIKNGKDHS